MATLQKITKTELEAEARSLEEQVSNQARQIETQAEQIKQMQITIQDLQGKLALSEKEKVVQRNLLNQKAKDAAINPQNLHTKLKASGHPPDIQEQIMKNAN